MCDGCYRSVQSGDQVMECRQCNYYLCVECRPQPIATFWGTISSLIDLATQPTCLGPGLPRCGQRCGASRRALSPNVSVQTSPSERYHGHRVEAKLKALFKLQDLNGNGLLEQHELVQLNSKIAMLHFGKDTRLSPVKRKYKDLFEAELDAEGQPVPFNTFRDYILRVLDDIDKDPVAQEMILDQWSIEARSAREMFRVPSFASSSDHTVMSECSGHSMVVMDVSTPCQVPLQCTTLSSIFRMATDSVTPRGMAYGGG